MCVWCDVLSGFVVVVWAHKKWNKIASAIKLIFYSSTITMIHGPINIRYRFMVSGPGSSVGIASELRAGRSGDRIVVGGRDFSAPVQTVPGSQPASSTVGNGSFPGVKSGRGVKLTPHPLLVPRLKKQSNYTSAPLLGFRGLFRGTCKRFLFLSFCRVLNVICSFLGNSPASEF